MPRKGRTAADAARIRRRDHRVILTSFPKAHPSKNKVLQSNGLQGLNCKVLYYNDLASDVTCLFRIPCTLPGNSLYLLNLEAKISHFLSTLCELPSNCLHRLNLDQQISLSSPIACELPTIAPTGPPFAEEHWRTAATWKPGYQIVKDRSLTDRVRPHSGARDTKPPMSD
jgi:hypothetical protein